MPISTGSSARGDAPKPPTWSDGEALAPGERIPVSVGQRVRNKYDVLDILGLGATTVVVVARVVRDKDATPEPADADADAPRDRVALKIMREAGATTERINDFIAAAKTAMPLTSEHAPKIYEVDTLASGLPYIAMELLDGHNLAAILKRDGVQRSYQAIDYITQACEALNDADRLKLSHGDLKPANLFLTHRPDGTPLIKVLDFGISRLRASPPAPITLSESTDTPLPPSSRRNGVAAFSNAMTGLPLYKAPEQLRPDNKGAPDGRTDVWALGAILFELVTGVQPFAGDTTEEVVSKIIEKSPPSIEAYLPNAPPGLGTIVHRCLEKERTRRYVTVGAFALALSDLGVKPSTSVIPAWDRSIDLSVDSLAAGVASVPTPALGDAPPPRKIPRTQAPTFVLPRRRSNTKLYVALALLLVGGLAVAGYVKRSSIQRAWVGEPRSPSPTGAASSAPAASASTIPIALPASSSTSPSVEDSKSPTGKPPRERHQPKKKPASARPEDPAPPAPSLPNRL